MGFDALKTAKSIENTVHLAQNAKAFFVQSDKNTKKRRKVWKFAKRCSIIVITLLINYLNISKILKRKRSFKNE